MAFLDGNMGANLALVKIYVFLGKAGNWNKPLFVALSGNTYKAFVKIKIGYFKVDEFRDAKSTTVQGFQHGAVAFALGC